VIYNAKSDIMKLVFSNVYMKNKRFIFTITEENQKLLKNRANRANTSKSSELNRIMSSYRNIHNENKSEIYKDTGYITNISLNSNNIGFSLGNLLINNNIKELIYFVEKNIKKHTTDELLLNKAELLKIDGSYALATELLLDNNFKQLDIKKYLLLANIAISQGDILNAEKYLIEAKVQLAIFPTNQAMYNNEYIITYAEYLWIANGVLSAIRWTKDNLSKLCNVNDMRGLVLLGDFYRDKGDYHKSKSYYSRALMSLNQNYITYYIRCLRGLSSIAKNEGDLITTEKLIFDALHIAKLSQDKKIWASVLANIGDLHQRNNNYAMAVKSYEEKYKIGKEISSIREIFYANYRLALSYISNGQYNKAIKILKNNSNATKFKRKYYFDIWEGFIRGQEDMNRGLNQVKTARLVASNNNEQKQVNIAEYVLGTLHYFHGDKQNKYYGKLLASDTISVQIKNNIKDILNGVKFIKTV